MSCVRRFISHSAAVVCGVALAFLFSMQWYVAYFLLFFAGLFFAHKNYLFSLYELLLLFVVMLMLYAVTAFFDDGIYEILLYFDMESFYFPLDFFIYGVLTLLELFILYLVGYNKRNKILG